MVDSELRIVDEQDSKSVNNNGKGDSDLETCVDYFTLPWRFMGGCWSRVCSSKYFFGEQILLPWEILLIKKLEIEKN